MKPTNPSKIIIPSPKHNIVILHSNTTMEIDFEIVISDYETRSFVDSYKPSLSKVIATMRSGVRP